MSEARFPFKRNRLRCVRCVNENRNKRKRLRWQTANHGCHCFDRAFLLAGASFKRSLHRRWNVSLLVLLDLSAAFDTVDHHILLSVLASRFSITSTALSWFKSYLTDRTQLFTYAGGQTSGFPVDCSVPQGSVLGPRCIISYTEDLVDLLERHDVQSHLCADD